MDQQLKQRLVGVTVIFSMAVIFLPMLLDGAGDHPEHLEISIPTPPEVPSYFIVEEKVAELTNEVVRLPQLEPLIVDKSGDPPDSKKSGEKTSRQVVTEKKSEPKDIAVVSKSTAEPSKSAKTTKSKPPVEVKKQPVKKQVGGSSWVIQVGSFSEKNKAYKLRDKLRKSGFSAVFIEKFKHNGVLNYRVRMGPFISRDKAKVVGNKIRAKYSIKGLVMRYEK